MRGTVLLRAAATGLALLALVACSSTTPRSEVAPLVDLSGTDLYVAAYDDDSLKNRLEALVDETAPVARAAGGWGRLTTDLLNPEVLDVVFIGAARETLNFGYGTEAASVLSRGDHVIYAMAGDSGSCWAVRISGSTETPSVLRGNVFAPNCSADKVADMATGPCTNTDPAECPPSAGSGWQSQWPPTATPTATGPDGLSVGEAPADTEDPNP